MGPIQAGNARTLICTNQGSAVNTCKTCRFLDRQGGHGGMCRRYPPKVSVLTNLNGETDWRSDWPYMHNDDWCGEWKGAEVEPDA